MFQSDSPISSAPANLRRFAQVTELCSEKAKYYRKLHANPWPSITERLKASGIQNYSIFEQEIEGRRYLFSYFEYSGQDFDSDMEKIAADPETHRWWKETDPCQIPLPRAAAEAKIWTEMLPVFFLA